MCAVALERAKIRKNKQQEMSDVGKSASRKKNSARRIFLHRKTTCGDSARFVFVCRNRFLPSFDFWCVKKAIIRVHGLRVYLKITVVLVMLYK